MKEVWKDIPSFRGYQVSNKGRVRSFWWKKHYPTGYGCYWHLTDTPRIMNLSGDGNGYLKVMLTDRDNGKRRCIKVHRIVAELFISHSPEEDTVDHIKSGPEGKLNNSVSNLRWMSRPENIRKAYRDGMCDKRIEHQKKVTVAIDIWTGNATGYSSASEAAIDLGLDRSTVIHAAIDGHVVANRYIFEYPDGEEALIYDPALEFIPGV